jgi:hypothetical protein
MMMAGAGDWPSLEIPAIAELASADQWVVWRPEQRDGKTTKVPYTPAGIRAKSTDPRSWSSYAECFQAAFVEGSAAGIGRVLYDAADQDLVAFDLDRCVDDAGAIEPWACAIAQRMNSYTEISPSGTGLRIFVRGSIPVDGRRKGKVEVYRSRRYVTVTGRHVDGFPDVVERRPEAVAALFAELFADDEPGPRPNGHDTGSHDLGLPSEPPEPLEPDRLDELRSQHPSLFDLSRFDGDQSRQDLALASIVARSGWPLVDAWRLIIAVRGGRKACRRDYVERTLRRAYAEKATGSPSKTVPLDIFGDFALAGEPELRPDMLPQTIAAFASDEAERLGVDLSMVAIPCLGVAAAAIRDQWQIQPKRADTRWLESARLWMAIVADIGSLKTPSIGAAVAPLRSIERKWLEEDAGSEEEYRLAEKTYNRAAEIYARKKAKGEHADQPAKPPRPSKRRLIVSDATTESLSDILLDNPGGVLSVRDELSGWFGSFDAYRERGANKDRGDWLELFNGGPRAIDRISRGAVAVPNWSACLLGGIQPEPMRRLAGRMADDGLVQRFLVVHSRRTGAGEDRAPDEIAIHGYRDLIGSLVDSRPNPDGSPVTLSDDAHEHRELVMHVVERIMILPDTSPAFRAHLSKWPGIFARLLLVFHLAECLSTRRSPEQPVSGATAEKVASFALDFLLPHAARFYSALFGSGEQTTHARWVAGLILSHRLQQIAPRDVYRAYRDLRGKPDEIVRVLGILELAGWLEPIEEARGRPPRQWLVNDAVHTIFAQRAEAERQRRDAEKARIQQAAQDLGLVKEAAA